MKSYGSSLSDNWASSIATANNPLFFLSICLLLLQSVSSAPLDDGSSSSSSWETDLTEYLSEGCYYQYRHYDDGEQIITNEPCLNCTCHNQVLMCYLRVCPFIKPVGQNCIIEKNEDQCCPTITCPQVPVELWTSTTLPPPLIDNDGLTSITDSSSEVALMTPGQGCQIDGKNYMDGMQIPRDSNNPCELCYCIRNHTACVMQECRLNVKGCEPIMREGSCCPIKYMCEDGLVLPQDFSGISSFTTSSTPKVPTGCMKNGTFYEHGASIQSNDPCQHCYCMQNEVVCAVEPCMGPLEGKTDNCVPQAPSPGECCPSEYKCTQNNITLDSILKPSEDPSVETSNMTIGCTYQGENYESLTYIPMEDPCDLCQCVNGKIICAKRECAQPPPGFNNCRMMPVKEGECCPNYECEEPNAVDSSEIEEDLSDNMIKPEAVKEEEISNEIAEDDSSDYDNYEDSVAGDHATRPLAQDEVSEGDRTHIDGQDLNKPDVGIVVDDLEQDSSSTTTTTQSSTPDEASDSDKTEDQSTEDKEIVPENNESKEDGEASNSVETTDVSYEENEDGSGEVEKIPSIEAVKNDNDYGASTSSSEEVSGVTEGSTISDDKASTESLMDQEVDPSTGGYKPSDETSNVEQDTSNIYEINEEDKNSSAKPDSNNQFSEEMKDTMAQNDDAIELNTIPGSSDIHFPNDGESENKDKSETEKEAEMNFMSESGAETLVHNDDKESEIQTTTINALYEVPVTTAVPSEESYDEASTTTIDSLESSDEQSNSVTDSQKETSTPIASSSSKPSEETEYSTTTASSIEVTSSIEDSETTKAEENVTTTTPFTQNENELPSGDSVEPIQEDDDYDIPTTEDAASVNESDENETSTFVSFSETTKVNDVPTTTASSIKESDIKGSTTITPVSSDQASTTTFTSINESTNAPKDDLEDSVQDNNTTTVFDMNQSTTSSPFFDSTSNISDPILPDISSEPTAIADTTETKQDDEITKIPSSPTETTKLDESSKDQDDSSSTTTPSYSEATNADESSMIQDDDVSITTPSYTETTKADESSKSQDDSASTSTPLSSETTNLDDSSKDQNESASTTTPLSSETTKADESSMSQDESASATTPLSSETTHLDDSAKDQNESASTTTPLASETTKADESSKDQDDTASTTTPLSSETTKLDDSSKDQDDNVSTTTPLASETTKADQSSIIQDDDVSITTPSYTETTKADDSSKDQDDTVSTTTPLSSDTTKADKSSMSQDESASATTPLSSETTKLDDSSKDQDDNVSTTTPLASETTKADESFMSQDDDVSITTPSYTETTKIENTSTPKKDVSSVEQLPTTTASSQTVMGHDATTTSTYSPETAQKDEPTEVTSKVPIIGTESSSMGATIEAQKEAATESPKNGTTDNNQDNIVFEAVIQDDDEETDYGTTLPTETDTTTSSSLNTSYDGITSTTIINESISQGDQESTVTQDPTAIEFPDSMDDSLNITVTPQHQEADQEKEFVNKTSSTNNDNESTVSIIDMFSTYAPDILPESDKVSQVLDDDVDDVESTTLKIKSTCLHNGVTYQDFDDIPSNDPCEVCYCNYGQAVCSQMVCNKLEGHEFCRPLPPKEGKCCSDQYECLSTTEDHMANVTIPSATTKPLDPSGKCDRNGTIYENGADVPITSKCYNSCTCIDTEFVCDYLPCKEAPQLPGLTCTEVPVEGECCPMFKCDDLSSNETSTQLPPKNITSTTSGPSSSQTTLSTLDETSYGETATDNATGTSTPSMTQATNKDENETLSQETTTTKASETTIAPTESGIDSMKTTNISNPQSTESSIEQIDEASKTPEFENNSSTSSEGVNGMETTVTPTEVISSTQQSTESMETTSGGEQTTKQPNENITKPSSEVKPSENEDQYSTNSTFSSTESSASSDGTQSNQMTTTMIPDSDGNVETTDKSKNESDTSMEEGTTIFSLVTTPSSTNVSSEKTDENATTVSSGIETSEKSDENSTTPSSEMVTSEKIDENVTTVSSGIETSEKSDDNATTPSSETGSSEKTDENATTVSSGIETSEKSDENATTVSSGIETSEKSDENSTTPSSEMVTSEKIDENVTTVSSGIETSEKSDENATTPSSEMATSEKTDENTTSQVTAMETSNESDESLTTPSGESLENNSTTSNETVPSSPTTGDKTSPTVPTESDNSGNETNTTENYNENVTSTTISNINSTEEQDLSVTTSIPETNSSSESSSDDKAPTTIKTESTETTTFSNEYLPPTTADPNLTMEKDQTLPETGVDGIMTTISPVPSVENTGLVINGSSLASTDTAIESQDNQSKPVESEVKTTTFASVDPSTQTPDIDSSSESDLEDQSPLNGTFPTEGTDDSTNVTTELPKIMDEEVTTLSSNLSDVSTSTQKLDGEKESDGSQSTTNNNSMMDGEINTTTSVPSIFESTTSDKKEVDNTTTDTEIASTGSPMENKEDEDSATTESNTFSSTTGGTTIISEADMGPEAMKVIGESTTLTPGNSTIVGEAHGSTFVFETTTKSSTTNKLKFCILNGMIVKNGGDVPDSDPCKLCSCYDGEVNCATQICAPPNGYENCTALPAEEGVCCPKYSCKSKNDAIEYDDVDEDVEENGEEEKELEDNSEVPSGNYSTQVSSSSSSESPATTTVSSVTGDVVGTASSDILDKEDVQESSADALKGTPISDAEGQVSLDSLGPGACLYDGKVYVSAQQIPRNNPCDFCFCFRGDIICLQQSCPPPIPGCREEIIDGFCCPRYECPVTMGFKNVTEQVSKHSLVSWLFGDEESNTPETVTTQVRGCEIQGDFYEVGAIVKSASGPCLQCRCGLNEKLECEPQLCEPQPLVKRMLTIRR